MTNYGECEIFKPIKNCKVSIEDQPEGLIHDGFDYVCPECDRGFTWDDELGCKPCGMYCEDCIDDDTCIDCAPGFMAMNDGKCHAGAIKFCKTVDSYDHTNCAVCQAGYALNKYKQCVSCRDVHQYCDECTTSIDTGKPTICTKCLPLTTLNDGLCYIDKCIKMAKVCVWNPFESKVEEAAQCSKCENGYQNVPAAVKYIAAVPTLTGGNCMECTAPGVDDQFAGFIACKMNNDNTMADSCTRCQSG